MATKALILLEGQGVLVCNTESGRACWASSNYPVADPAQYNFLAAESVESIGVDTDDLNRPIRECSRLSVMTYDIDHDDFLRARKTRYMRQSASSAGISVYRERTPYRFSAALQVHSTST